MARVYSARLADVPTLFTGPTVLGTVPASTIWVVRNMSATYLPDDAPNLDGFVIQNSATTILWRVGKFAVVPAFTYEWGGRHVLNSGEELTFDTVDPTGWGILVSGYALALP
jgi:hypothetical protein